LIFLDSGLAFLLPMVVPLSEVAELVISELIVVHCLLALLRILLFPSFGLKRDW
jgi:hypothetical protein